MKVFNAPDSLLPFSSRFLVLFAPVTDETSLITQDSSNSIDRFIPRAQTFYTHSKDVFLRYPYPCSLALHRLCEIRVSGAVGQSWPEGTHSASAFA